MFLGSWEPSFDKLTRRIALPKKIRDYLATGQIILSYGFEKSIFGFDTKSWEKESKNLLERSLTDRDARNTRRYLFSSAELVRVDAQGRIVIPSNLLEYAKIQKPIIIGAGDHFEIWDIQSWHRVKSKLQG
mgnify:CR=1 FL=1